MNVVKFRVWDIDEKKMYSHSQLHNSELIAALYATENIKGKGHIKIMQYVGVNDRKGIEIYEGDIIRNHTAALWVISFKNGSFIGTWNNSGHEHTMQLYDNPISKEDWIVGNIYQNSELLK